MNSATGGNIIYKFIGDKSGLDNTTNSVNNSFKNVTKSMLVANVATKAVSAGFNMIKTNAGDAVKRLDTLNNYPKVMSNLGIGTKEANASINKMSKALMGLPTTLDAGALAVQRLTSKNSDIARSTDMFLALNDAILAGGAPMELQSSALEQISQAYSKNKPDMMEWRTIMSAMPAQMKQVAQAMNILGTDGKGDADALGVALREGAISMEDFMSAIMQLDKEGVAGFQSFSKQAMNTTGGMQTNITNAKNAVVRAVASMVEAINKGLQKAGLGNVGEVLLKAGQGIEKAFAKITPTITKFVIKLIEIFRWIKKNKVLIMAIVIPIITMIETVKTLIAIMNAFKIVMLAVNAVLAINPFIIIVGAIIGLIALFTFLWSKCEWFRNFWINLWNGIKQVAIAVVSWFASIPEKVNQIVDGIINIIKNLPYYIGYAIGWITAKMIIFVSQTIPNFINDMIKWFKELPGKLWNILLNVVAKIIQWKTSMINKGREVASSLYNAVVNGLRNLPSAIQNVGRNIVTGLWNGMRNAKDWIVGKVKDFARGILDGMKKALGIHSPSTEFAILGKFSVLGYTEALDNMQKDIQDKVKETFGLSPQLTGSMNNHFSPNVMVNNNIDVSTDPLGQTVKKIKTFSGGAKNDYNYGMGV